MKFFALMLTILALVIIAATVGTTRAEATVSLNQYRTIIKDNQWHWTNRALDNRCRELFTFSEFTKTPLHIVSPRWRDEHIAYAKKRHHRAQNKSSLCIPSNPRDLGKYLAARRYGWTGYQWEALDAIVMRESGWNPCRHFPSTTNCSYAGPSACGIPQASPCSKLLTWCGASTIGTCPAYSQIIWTLDYIRGRYGSPSEALANGSTY